MSKFRQLISLGIALVIIMGSLGLILYMNLQIRPDDLSSYIPKSAVFAFRISATELGELEKELLGDSSEADEALLLLNEHLDQVSDLATEVKELIWFTTDTDDTIQPSLLIEFNKKLSSRQLEKLEKVSLVDLGYFFEQLLAPTRSNSMDITSTKLLKLRPATYILTPLAKEADFFHRAEAIFEPDTALAMYIEGKVRSNFEHLVMFGQDKGTLADSGDDLVVYLDQIKDQIRMRVMQERHKPTAIVPVLPALSTPNQHELVFSNTFVDSMTTTGMSDRIDTFLEGLSLTYSLPRDVIDREIKGFSSAIINKDEWLIVGEYGDDKMADYLSAAYGAEVMISKLVDNSDYRELVKRVPEASHQSIDGKDIRVWSHENKKSLYVAVVTNQFLYLSNSFDLLKAQLISETKVEPSQQAQQCLGSELEDIVPTVFLLGYSGDDRSFLGSVTQFSWFRVDKSAFSSVFYYCFS